MCQLSQGLLHVCELCECTIPICKQNGIAAIVHIEGRHESVLYVDVVYVHIEGRHESILYVVVNMGHVVARTKRGPKDVIAPLGKKYERSKNT